MDTTKQNETTHEALIRELAKCRDLLAQLERLDQQFQALLTLPAYDKRVVKLP